jgi:hypothetical protein
VTDEHYGVRRQHVVQATDDVVEIAAELADWYDRSHRDHDLGSDDRDAMLQALSEAVARLRRAANAS